MEKCLDKINLVMQIAIPQNLMQISEEEMLISLLGLLVRGQIGTEFIVIFPVWFVLLVDEITSSMACDQGINHLRRFKLVGASL